MNRLNNPAELEIFRQDILKRRERIKKRVRVCAGPACASQAGEAIAKALQETPGRKRTAGGISGLPPPAATASAPGVRLSLSNRKIFFMKSFVWTMSPISSIGRSSTGKSSRNSSTPTRPTAKRSFTKRTFLFTPTRNRSSFGTPAGTFITDIEDYISRGGYSGLVKALSAVDPRGDHRRSQTFRSPGPGRRRFSYRDQMGILPEGQGRPSNTSSATPTKGTRGPTWTGRSWRETPIRSSRE